MADNLELVRGVVDFKLARLQLATAAIPLGRRGSNLAVLMVYLLARVEADLATLDAETSAASGAQPLLAVIARKLERLNPQLDSLHEILSSFRDAVGRSDVPVGLQHLIDVLMESVVDDSGDPIVQLSAVNMYSTIDLVSYVNDLFQKTGFPPTAYTEPHPIAFNLPALDPQNALLAPILAHEVGHTAANQSLLAALQVAIDPSPVDALLNSQLAAAGLSRSSQEAADWVNTFQAWCAELMCDAIASRVTGPSFTLSFCAFAPPSSAATIGTHPSERDRVRMQLDHLETLGWTPIMEREFPALTAWLRDVATHVQLTGHPKETFLRGAVALVQDQIIAVAGGQVATALDASSADVNLSDSAHWLRQGVPIVEFSGTILGPWEIVLAGWVAAIQERGDSPTTLAKGAGDAEFNAVLVKALELSSIVSAWRSH